MRTVDIEVASANRLLEQESQYQREVAQAGYDRQREVLMAEAQSALIDQASTSDQRLMAFAEESQRHLDLLKRDAEEQRANLTEKMAAMQQEVFTPKGNLQQSLNENSALNSQLRVGHEAWHSSQETVVALQNQLQEERQRTGLLSGDFRPNARGQGIWSPKSVHCIKDVTHKLLNFNLYVTRSACCKLRVAQRYLKGSASFWKTKRRKSVKESSLWPRCCRDRPRLKGMCLS